MKKKIFVILMSFIMIMTMMPMQAFADTKGDLQNKKENDEKIETEIGDTGIYLVGNEQAVDGKDYSLDNNTITIKTDPWEIKGENESISLNFDQVLGKNEYEVNNFLKVKSIALTYTTTFNIEGTIVIENNFSLGGNGNLSLNGKGHLIIEDGQLIGTDSNDCEINLNLFKVKNSNGAGINLNQGGSYATHSTLNITGGSVIVEGSTDGINFQNTSLSISENAAFYSYGKAGLPARSNMYLSESGMYGSDSPYSYAARNHMTQRVYDRGLKEHFYGWYQVYERAAKSIFHPAQKTEYPIEDTGITVKGDHEPITAEDYKEVIYQKDEKIVNIYDNLWEVSGENRDIEIRYEPLQNLETDDGVSIRDLRAKSFKVSSPKFETCKVNITGELNLHKDFIFENNLTLSGSKAIISNGSLASPIDEPKQLTLDLKSLDVRNQDSQLNMGTAIFAGGVNVKQGKVIAITDVPPNEEDNLTGIAMIAANENIDIDNNAEVFAAGNYAGMLSNKNTHYDKLYYGNTVKMSYIENERVISHTNPVQKTVCGIYGYILNVSDSHNDNDAKTVYRPLNNHMVDMIVTSAGTIKALVDGEPISKTVDIESQVLLKFIPSPGYKLTGWEVKGKSSGKTIEVNLNKFTMPREDVEVNVKVEGTTKYNILKEEPEWGTLSLSKTKASSGETIDITYSDKDEHETTLDKFLVSYINEEGKKEYVTVTKDADKGTFIMPGYEVTVTVSGKDNLHDITYTQPEGAVISGPTEGKVTNTVQLSSEVSQGFKLKNYLVSYNGHTDTLTPDEEGMAYFTMPNYEVNVSAEVETIFYNINVIQPEYGYLTVNKDSAMIDDVITLTYSESLMIALKSFVVTTETGKQVEVTPVKGVSNVVTFVMPPENVTVTATEALKHSIEIVNVEHGTITSDVSLAPSNTEVKLSCVTEQEYGLVNYIVKNKETQEAIEVSKDGAFIMPDADVVVTGVVKQKHSVDISDSEHGVVEVSESNPIEGTNITVIPKPEEGYKMRICSVIGQDTQTEIPLVDNVFVMPDEAVTVTALFMKDETKYSVEIEDSQFGETIATPVEGIPGTDIQLSSVPNEGYKLDSYEVTEQQTGMTVQVVDGKFKMPGDNVKVKAVYSLKNYNITITNPEHGIVTSDQESAVMGQEVKLSYEAISSGYHADKYIVFSAKGPIEVSEDGTFTMPAADVEVTAEESYGDYTISVTNPEHGTINVDSKTAMEGDIIQLSFTPEEGYELEHYNVTCAGKEVPIYNDGTFKMPAADVEVTATTKATKYFVAVAKATNGILTVDKTGASVGEEVAIQATADTGYKL